jgi:hypothetical protein
MKVLFFYTFALFFFTTLRLFASEKTAKHPFPPGSLVQIFNKENHETLGNLNGALGVVQEFNEDSKEYILVYTAGLPFSAKHEDLQLLGDMLTPDPEKVFDVTISYFEFLLEQYKDSIQAKRYNRSSPPIKRDAPVTVYYIPTVPSSRLVNGFHPQIEGMNNLLVRSYEKAYRRQDTVDPINYESFFSQISAYHHLKNILDQEKKTAFFSGYFYYDDKKPEEFSLSLEAHEKAQEREAFLLDNAQTLSLCKKTQKEDDLRNLLRDPKYFDLAQGLLDPYLGGFTHLFRHDGYDLSTFQKTTPMLEINLLKLSLLMEHIIAPILHPSFIEGDSMVSKETSQQLFLKFLQKIKTGPWPEALKERAQDLGDVSQSLDEEMIKDFVKKACKDIILFFYEQTMLTTFSNINNYVAENPQVENIVLSFGILQDFEAAAQDEEFGLAFPYVGKYLPTMDESTLEEKTNVWLAICSPSSTYNASLRSLLDSLTRDFFIKRESGDKDESKTSIPPEEPVEL